MNTEKYPVILYGAGDNGKSALSLLRGRGIEPVAFCSRNAARHPRVGGYCGLPIWSREEVKKRFGSNFRIWITPFQPTREEIENELLDMGFVDEHMILNPLTCCGGEEYFSCGELQYGAVIASNMLQVCCRSNFIVDNPPRLLLSSGRIKDYGSVLEYYRDVVKDFINYKTKLIEDLRLGRSCVCSGCASLKKAQWGKPSEKIEMLILGMEFPCQLSCIYCNWESNARHKNPEVIKNAMKIDVPTMVQAMEQEGMQLAYPITMASGEISIYPQRKEILTSISKYPVSILSNCVNYDEQIAKLVARDDGSFLNVSLDAGTAETYYKVKGLNVFEKVLANIRRYKAAGNNIQAKYILLPENCDRANIDGFIDFCAEVGVDKVQISRDINVKQDELPQSILDAAAYMVKQAKKKRLRYELIHLFDKKNQDYVKSKVEE